ncbi:DNA-binding transcriptional MerR regulator [Salana multivorans]|uniref:DNA-binding transcriptional MerR regulator n=1 Tax=Salana multivorans TaxID=120377 RepID=A0A3N2DAW9_9MICO|nr:DNA-binding transcriptional MerR regulator [Salana multivorans]
MSRRDMVGWSIQDVVRRTGVTSRTLRHYDAIGLLPPSFVAAGGIRHYDDDALVRLQRILLLRDLGLSLATIGRVVGSTAAGGGPAPGDGTAARPAPATSETEALTAHLELLEVERTALDRRIAAVRRTIRAREEGSAMTSEMFDGFDHTQYEEEVTRRWGRDAYETSTAWWEGRSDDEKRDLQREVADLNAAWVAAAVAGEDPAGAAAQALAERHVAWLTSVPGTPARSGDAGERTAYVLGLADMYVGDERFRANWTGDPVHAVENGPAFVRDALRAWAARQG